MIIRAHVPKAVEGMRTRRCSPVLLTKRIYLYIESNLLFLLQANHNQDWAEYMHTLTKVVIREKRYILSLYYLLEILSLELPQIEEKENIAFCIP